MIDTILLHTSSASRSLLYYSYPLKVFVDLVTTFGNIFFGLAFVSTLFHLPTAEAFDRKRSEVASLHNLSRLITQVFDFNELMDTVTSMTLEDYEADSWLEVIHSGDEAIAERAAAQMLLQGTPERPAAARAALQKEGVRYLVQIAGMKNITEPEIEQIIAAGDVNVRETVMVDLKPMVVDDLTATRASGTCGNRISRRLTGCRATGVAQHDDRHPLATKEAKYGFVKDDVDLISTFADPATIAIGTPG